MSQSIHEHEASSGVETPVLSLVIPCYNEEGNLRPLVAAIREAIEPLKVGYEIVITDDCSRDNSWAVLKELAAADPRILVQRFATNSGQSAAFWAGLKAARGRYLVTLDADLQNDPRDLPQFLEKLERADCVAARAWNRAARATALCASLPRASPMGAQQTFRRGHQRRGLLFPRVQTGVHWEFEILQRHAPVYADAFQDRGFHRHGNARAPQPTPRRQDELRRLEPALRIVLRFARGQMDEEKNVQI